MTNLQQMTAKHSALPRFVIGLPKRSPHAIIDLQTDLAVASLNAALEGEDYKNAKEALEEDIFPLLGVTTFSEITALADKYRALNSAMEGK